MFNLFILFTSLFLTWIIFSGFIEPFFIIAGIVSCVIALYFTKKMSVLDYNSYPIYLKPGMVFYLFWLFKEIFISSLAVSLRVWQAKPDISPVLRWISTSQNNDHAKALYANSITLTPGTICIQVKGDKMRVHALTGYAMDSLIKGEMDRKITKITK